MFLFENEIDLYGDERVFEVNFYVIIWFCLMILYGFWYIKVMGYLKMLEIFYFFFLIED